MAENSYTTASQQVNNSLKPITQAIEALHIGEISSVVNKQIQPTLDAVENIVGNVAEIKEYADKHRIDFPRFTDSNMLSLNNGVLDKEIQPQQPLILDINIEHD